MGVTSLVTMYMNLIPLAGPVLVPAEFLYQGTAMEASRYCHHSVYYNDHWAMAGVITREDIWYHSKTVSRLLAFNSIV